METFIKYPDTEQFRNVVREVSQRAAYVGKDDNGNPVYDGLKKKPTIEFSGTVKLHGTNAAVCENPVAGIWCQSRGNIITPTNDNAGFASFVEAHKEAFQRLFNEIRDREGISGLPTISIYGEWAGKGIQKGVAISEIPRAFFIFGIRITKDGELEARHNNVLLDPPVWISIAGYRSIEDRIFNISDYWTEKIVIDFNRPEDAQNKLIEITDQVEQCCPIGKAFGVEGIGEGVVWTGHHEGHTLRFKVKGEKHSSSKVKTLAAVDTEKLENVDKFVDYAVTKSRFDQAVENVCTVVNEVHGDTVYEISMKDVGSLIKWVMSDIIKEETDTLTNNGLTPKDISGKVAARIREFVTCRVIFGDTAERDQEQAVNLLSKG